MKRNDFSLATAVGFGMFIAFLSAVLSIIPIILPGILSFLMPNSVRRANKLSQGQPHSHWLCILSIFIGTLAPFLFLFLFTGKIEMNWVSIIFLINVATTTLLYPVGLWVGPNKAKY